MHGGDDEDSAAAIMMVVVTSLMVTLSRKEVLQLERLEVLLS